MQEISLQLSGSCQAVVRQPLGSRQAVATSCQAVVCSRQTVARQSLGSRQAVARQFSGSHRAVVRHTKIDKGGDSQFFERQLKLSAYA